jgi:hypothetical protein
MKRSKKATHTASVPLEAHQDASSSSDVSTPCALLPYGTNSFYLCVFILQPLMQKFLSIGAECLEIQKTTDESKGTYLYSLCFSVAFFFLLLFITRGSLFSSYL